MSFEDPKQVLLWLLVAAQAALFVMFSYERRRLRESQAAAAKRHYAEVTREVRLMLVDVVTASIAHEVDQSLSAILYKIDRAASLLHEPRPNLELVGELLNDVRTDGLRAHDIVQRCNDCVLRSAACDACSSDLVVARVVPQAAI